VLTYLRIANVQPALYGLSIVKAGPLRGHLLESELAWGRDFDLVVYRLRVLGFGLIEKALVGCSMVLGFWNEIHLLLLRYMTLYLLFKLSMLFD
jgi:hypothetical protein